MTWGGDEHLRAIFLEFFDLKRLTTQVATRLLRDFGMAGRHLGGETQRRDRYRPPRDNRKLDLAPR